MKITLLMLRLWTFSGAVGAADGRNEERKQKKRRGPEMALTALIPGVVPEHHRNRSPQAEPTAPFLVAHLRHTP